MATKREKNPTKLDSGAIYECILRLCQMMEDAEEGNAQRVIAYADAIARVLTGMREVSLQDIPQEVRSQVNQLLAPYFGDLPVEVGRTGEAMDAGISAAGSS